MTSERTVRLLTVLPVAVLLAIAPALAQQAVPALTGRVVDQADILSAATEQTLTELLAAHEAETSNQVAVLTVPALEGETIEAFSLRVAETWELGTAERDNGALLVIAVDDRKLRIEVGYGLEGYLTDATSRRIIDNEIVPLFRSEDFDAGVLAGVQSIVGVLEGTYDPPAASASEPPPFFVGLIFLLVPALFMLIGIFLVAGGVRWFLFLFLIPFFAVGGWALTGSVAGMIVVLGIYAMLYIGSGFHPRIRAIHKRIREAQKTGKSVKVGPFTVSGSSGSSGGGWSSGGSSFSGGGGSFGGGGASGGW